MLEIRAQKNGNTLQLSFRSAVWRIFEREWVRQQFQPGSTLFAFEFSSILGMRFAFEFVCSSGSRSKIYVQDVHLMNNTIPRFQLGDIEGVGRNWIVHLWPLVKANHSCLRFYDKFYLQIFYRFFCWSMPWSFRKYIAVILNIAYYWCVVLLHHLFPKLCIHGWTLSKDSKFIGTERCILIIFFFTNICFHIWTLINENYFSAQSCVFTVELSAKRQISLHEVVFSH